MRISILVLTLVVIYGTCSAYAEESTGLIKEKLNGRHHLLLNFPNTPLEKSLSRNKRSILLSPINTALQLVNKFTNNTIIKPLLDFAEFLYNILIGKNVCPKVEGLSLNLIENLILHPIQTIETIICYIVQAIGAQGRALTSKSFELLIQFIKKIFLPGLHTFLNQLVNTGLLPPNIVAFVSAFNAVYNLLKLLGYI